MSATTYPVHVHATPEPQLSRWLWLVKWVLAIPHYVVLVFLWAAFVLLSAVALVAIVFTGRYPRGIFDFNVGVLRWSWRVAYYAYGALATDRYPPFTLDEVPDYPAHLSVEYPAHLSRGLVLVKWWLLAIPHYLLVGLFVGSGVYLAWDGDTDAERWVWGGGVIGLLTLVAAVTLMFTGRYPQQIFDLVLGLNRWVLRVAAYAALMTDEYPPFRLDMGGADPDAARLAVPAAAAAAGGAPVAPGAATPVAAPAETGGRARSWGPGRVLTAVLGGLAFLLAGGLLLGGGSLAVADRTLRDDTGFLMSPTQTVGTSTYAVTSDPLHIDARGTGDAVPEGVLGDVALRAHGQAGEELFVGVAPADAAAEYLAGVGHATLTGLDEDDGDLTATYRDHPGSEPSVVPGDSDVWVASASGAGEQRISWTPESGDWTVVVMNADGGAGVAADLAVGAEAPMLGWVVVGMLVAGGLSLALAVGLLLGALYARRSSTS